MLPDKIPLHVTEGVCAPHGTCAQLYIKFFWNSCMRRVFIILLSLVVYVEIVLFVDKQPRMYSVDGNVDGNVVVVSCTSCEYWCSVVYCMFI